MSKHSNKKSGLNKKLLAVISTIVVVVLAAWGGFSYLSGNHSAGKTANSAQVSSYKPADDEKTYLKNKFDGLLATNSDTIGYVYAPGTQLDEPIVQTTDNSTYLDKTFDGGNEPLLGTVFMDTDNNKNCSDRLTWLFGHARGSQVADHRMFNDVNY